MKTIRHSIRIVSAILALCAANLSANPRPPSTPWPGSSPLLHLSFDLPSQMPTNQVPDPSIWAESWRVGAWTELGLRP